jgi:hypothetical protein
LGKSLIGEKQSLKRDHGRIILIAIALLVVWARGSREIRQETDVICQSSVLPACADAVYAPALVEARLDGNCAPVAGLPVSLPWAQLLSSAVGVSRTLEANLKEHDAYDAVHFFYFDEAFK